MTSANIPSENRWHLDLLVCSALDNEDVSAPSVGNVSFQAIGFQAISVSFPHFPGHSLMAAALSKDWLPFTVSQALLEYFVLHLALL